MAPSGNAPSNYENKSRQILLALVFPTMAIILNGSMFGVALPTIRTEFAMEPDVTSWLSIAFSLPFMMFMPLYGRLGDELGKARLLTLGIVIFFCGTLLIWLSNSLALIFVGRLIQGVGSAGITPLSLAIISARFSAETRGNAIGLWNSTAPFTSIFAPTIGGFLTDNYGWRTFLIPALAVSIIALLIVRARVPSLRGKPNWQILRHFDWGGVLLLSSTIISLIFYLSSRPVTGVEPLRDWRLFLAFIASINAFIYWERRHIAPLIDLQILKNRIFVTASLGMFCRMSLMVSIAFLLPLYLADLYNLSASGIGWLATIHAIALLISIRSGGWLADTYPNRRLVLIGISVQTLVMVYLALLPANVPLYAIFAAAIMHGLGAGVVLPAFHRTAIGSVSEDHSGAAAGVYSMTRFGGSLLSTAITGVILQVTQSSGVGLLQSYQLAFAFLIVLGVLGLIVSSGLRN